LIGFGHSQEYPSIPRSGSHRLVNWSRQEEITAHIGLRLHFEQRCGDKSIPAVITGPHKHGHTLASACIAEVLFNHFSNGPSRVLHHCGIADSCLIRSLLDPLHLFYANDFCHTEFLIYFNCSRWLTAA
jgi:hypothetical protein